MLPLLLGVNPRLLRAVILLFLCLSPPLLARLVSVDSVKHNLHHHLEYPRRLRLLHQVVVVPCLQLVPHPPLLRELEQFENCPTGGAEQNVDSIQLILCSVLSFTSLHSI